jgi:hypothetical protein
MTDLKPLILMALAAGCTGGAKAPSAGESASNVTGPRKLHLIFTGNVHGELEPCG